MLRIAKRISYSRISYYFYYRDIYCLFQLVTESSLVDTLTIDGEPIYHLAKCPEMLCIAKVILIDCASHFKEHPVSVRFYAHYVALSTVYLQNFACLSQYVACLTPMFCFRR